MFYVPANSPEDWRNLLADPVLHWKDGFSAKSLALTWFKAGGLPPNVKALLEHSESDALSGIECLMCFPEYKVNLPGGSRASQNDIFVLAKTKRGLASIMVEGKARESFGPTVSEWIESPSEGRTRRLEYILGLLQLSRSQASSLRYQLLHRTVSVLIEAKRFCCPTGVMLVHSFSDCVETFADFEKFLSMYGLKARKNTTVGPIRLESIDLFFAWIEDISRSSN